MNTFRLRLRLLGPLATPLVSGTLFGQLCWLRRWRDGETALERWLADFPRNPWLMSSACPAGMLPFPLLAPLLPPPGADGGALDRFNQLKKRQWIAADRFFERRKTGLSGNNVPMEDAPSTSDARAGTCHLTVHNSINRHTGTTPEAGGLYFMEEWWPGSAAAELDIYFQGQVTPDELADLFGLLGEQGFGRDANLGRGLFTVRVEAVDPEWFGWTGGNRRMSLSCGSLTPDMVDPRYRIHVHYGKLGGEWSQGAHSPFKNPLLLMAPGATFRAATAGPFGALLEGVHPELPQVRHHACHLTLSFNEIAPAEDGR
ncbi:MAG: hypothetical protein HQL82_13740 [Magnetococcales bacterium]|nr:hypothetical protein [Magnetococcales bacterium]